jgi:hypothetical protein
MKPWLKSKGKKPRAKKSWSINPLSKNRLGTSEFKAFDLECRYKVTRLKFQDDYEDTLGQPVRDQPGIIKYPCVTFI